MPVSSAVPENELTLENGERLACDAVLWATPGAPPDLIRGSGLATDAGGFLRVRETLQAEANPAVFGTGDCVSFAAVPACACHEPGPGRFHDLRRQG